MLVTNNEKNCYLWTYFFKSQVGVKVCLQVAFFSHYGVFTLTDPIPILLQILIRPS